MPGIEVLDIVRSCYAESCLSLQYRREQRLGWEEKSYYFTNNTGGTGANSAIPVLDILTGLLGGPTGGIAAAAHGGVTASQLNGMGDVTSGISALLSNQTADAAGAPTVHQIAQAYKPAQ